ncbi:MAG: hypothetical protein WAL90_02400 [Desulfobacterales bacterium]
MRTQFNHVVDIAPTIYELLAIPHPKVVNGWEQMPMDGISLAYTFDEPTAATHKQTQFFDNNGSRAIYQDGWMVGTFDLKRTVPAAFTATETFDVGLDLGSPVSLNYHDRRPFGFSGKVDKVTVELIK